MKSNDDPVIIKINSPLIDRIDTKKLKIMAMIKGQIQSEVIDEVQYELENTGSNTISRTFIFDRNTNVGLIHIGDKFLACVASDDLRPPEGQECEKRILKKFGEPNVLYAR
jgi:predicted NUDIX family phosphoesterase